MGRDTENQLSAVGHDQIFVQWFPFGNLEDTPKNQKRRIQLRRNGSKKGK
jgi:hypothetical protein